MMWRQILIAVVLAASFVVTAVAHAGALEPRPWLCRAKPVFSSDKPMTYEVTKRDSGRWILSFMRCGSAETSVAGGCTDQSAGGSGGFTVVSTRDLSGHIDGTLAPGQWYAVALYRSGSRWICPGYAGESDEPSPGVISDLCYSPHEDEGSSCRVRLTVRPAEAGSAGTGSVTHTP